jgi:phage N-6-adenine-methyltransferase
MYTCQQAGIDNSKVNHHLTNFQQRILMQVHFSSKTDLHATPQAFFDKLNQEFCFTLDVCANEENAKCEKFFSQEDDGLAQEWSGVVWMNPPYGREIGKWMKKANDSAKQGNTVVCLVPARTDTNWWHDYAIQHEVRFVKGRLKFGDAKNPAPFPSAVVVMKPKHCVDKV